MRKRALFSILLFLSAVILLISYQIFRHINENKILKKVIERLQADSRIAEVIVAKVELDKQTGKNLTTIKFLEYDTRGRPLAPKYFTFSGNTIQFQSLVIRFDDFYIVKKDPLRGRSAYLFLKVFMLDGANTEEFELTPINHVPGGYKAEEKVTVFEKKLWRKFWEYALNSSQAKMAGVKNAQIEAPGTRFLPGAIYTIKIEHDGGMRIDSKLIPGILKGEHIPFK